MRKYSKKAQELIGRIMRKKKAGKLYSSSGDKVTDDKQAIAIGISEAREKGYKVPPASKSSTRKKSKRPTNTIFICFQLLSTFREKI